MCQQNTNIVNSTDNSSISSLYSWSTTSLRSLSARSMANNQENLSKTSLNGQTLSFNNEVQVSSSNSESSSNNESNSNDDVNNIDRPLPNNQVN